MHQIGEVAGILGLSLRTIRYYEEAHLVPPSERSSGGARLYTEDDIRRLTLVRHMKPLNLTIEEMRNLLTTRDQLADRCTPRRERLILLDRLAAFAELAQERCQRLSHQLRAGEATVRTLRAQIKAANEKSFA